MCREYNFVQYVHMKIITTTNARKNIGKILDRVKYYGDVFAIGRRDSIDALLIKFPNAYNKDLNEITNIRMFRSRFLRGIAFIVSKFKRVGE